MAVAPDINNQNLEELEREITCAVCHKHYQEAKLLPCNHYYCGACIETLAKRSLGRPFLCPECRKDTNLPPGGVEQLQSAFFVERMKDVYGKMAKVAGTVEATCECCSEGKAVAFCRQCTDFICAECVTQHRKMKPFAGHKVTTLDDLKKGGTETMPLKETPLPKCEEHDEQMKIFCLDCNRPICRDCTVIDHNGHNCNFLKKYATEARKTLRDSLAQLENLHSNITSANKKVAGTEAQVVSQEEEICKTIKQSFCHLKVVLVQQLEQQETELLNKVLTLAQEKKDALAAQKKGLQMARTEIQSLVEFVKRNVENTSDQDLISLHTQLQSKVKEEEKRHQQLSLDPATSADIACCPPSPDDIPRDLGNVFRASLTPSPAQLKKPSYVTLKIHNHQNPTIQAELKSLVKPASSVRVNVVKKGDGIYQITYTPRVRGRHDLVVKVDGKYIAGSPLRVFVKIHPTQLGSPVRKITGVNQPWGIAINDKQQLVVAECGRKTITIRERDGKRLQNIGQFTKVCGVATGPDGAIYATDISTKSIRKFDSNGKLIKTIKNDFNYPSFIKYINNQLYVPNHGSNEITILDTDCNIIGTIPTIECPKPYDIAEGEDGLYVVGRGEKKEEHEDDEGEEEDEEEDEEEEEEEGKISIYTCAPNGEFRRHINIQLSSANLFKPRGICFGPCNEHIFVTGCGVDVFTPDGKRVATFGKNMNSSSGIAIDEDGFVYVCDYDDLKKNILVF